MKENAERMIKRLEESALSKGTLIDKEEFARFAHSLVYKNGNEGEKKQAKGGIRKKWCLNQRVQKRKMMKMTMTMKLESIQRHNLPPQIPQK